MLIDLSKKTPDNVARANTLLDKLSVKLPNVLLENGAEEVFQRLNTQGYGYAVIGPDGNTIGTHLQLPEAEKQVKAAVSSAKSR